MTRLHWSARTLLCLVLVLYVGAGCLVLPKLVFHADLKVETDQDPRQARSLALEQAFPAPQPLVLLFPAGTDPFAEEVLTEVASLVQRLEASVETRSFRSLGLWSPGEPAQGLRESFRTHPVYQKLFLPAPGQAWAVYATVTTEAEFESVEAVLAAFPRVVPGGKPWVQRTLDRAMAADLALVFPLSCVLLAGAFAFVTRRPLRTLVLTLAAALPAWGVLIVFSVGQFPLNFSSLLAPLLTLALATTYTIHIHHHAEEHGNDWQVLVRERGRAIFWSACITGLGFSSLWFSPIASLRQLGFFLVAGLLLTLVWTLGVLPFVLDSGGKKRPEAPLGVDSPKRRRTIALAALAVVLVAAWGLPQFRQASRWTDYLSPATQEGRGLDQFEALFPGWQEASLHLRYDGQEPWLEPDRWRALERWSAQAERDAGAGSRIWSVVDVVGPTEPGTTRESLAESLELLPREAAVNSLISDDRNEVVVQFGFAGGVGGLETLEEWKAKAQQAFPGALVEWAGPVLRREIGLAAFLQGEAMGLLWFFVLAGAMIVLRLRSWKRGLMALVPAAAAAVVFAGLAGLLHWPFSEATALVAAACIGQTTDDGLLWSLLPSTASVRASLAESTLLLSAGLSAILFSRFTNIVETGWLVLAALNFSTLIVLYVLPRRANP